MVAKTNWVDWDGVSAQVVGVNTVGATNLNDLGNEINGKLAVGGAAGSAAVLTTTRNIDGQAFNGSVNITVIAPGTHAATAKTTPADADEFPMADSAAAFVLKRWSFANMKAALKTYFDSLTTVLTNKDLSSSTNTLPTTVPRVLLWSGAAWPNRPADTRPTFFIGGSASTNAPADADIAAGDVWIPATS
jgi:hypothetical protein